MKFCLSMLVLAVFFSLGGGSAAANDNDRRERSVVRAARAAAQKQFKELDTNSDDNLSKEEYLAGRSNQIRAEAVWKRLAGDKESVTLVEYTTYMVRQAKKAERDRADKEKDKK